MRNLSFSCFALFGFVLLSLSSPFVVYGQKCDGAELFTHENFLYGRFEVSMQSAPGSGIVSSFFLYNKDVGCNSPQEDNEIDVEMTGNSNSIYFTSHHPGNPNPWFYGENFDLGFNPHQEMHMYAIEWEPGIVRWLVDDELIYVQDEEAANDLMYPMAIFMNIWAGDLEDWVGPWDPSVMPQQAIYDYVRYYEYAPGNGNYGTNNNFRFRWQDEFNSLDGDRWATSDFTEFDRNFCSYMSRNISTSEGLLYLTIDEPDPSNTPIPVTFSINTMGVNLNPTDIIYLNGTFNNWCGTCNPMSQNSDNWELTLNLPPGRHEYLYTVNNWEVVGDAPLNSDCDFKPCDEFGNYGFILTEDKDEMILDTYCWGSCDVCSTTSTSEVNPTFKKELIRIIDLSGRDTPPVPNRLLLYLYSDGSVEKRIVVN